MSFRVSLEQIDNHITNLLEMLENVSNEETEIRILNLLGKFVATRDRFINNHHIPSNNTEGSIRIRDIVNTDLRRDILEIGLDNDDYVTIINDDYNFPEKELYQAPPDYISNPPSYSTHMRRRHRRTKGPTPTSKGSKSSKERKVRRVRKSKTSKDSKESDKGKRRRHRSSS